MLRLVLAMIYFINLLFGVPALGISKQFVKETSGVEVSIEAYALKSSINRPSIASVQVCTHFVHSMLIDILREQSGGEPVNVSGNIPHLLSISIGW